MSEVGRPRFTIGHALIWTAGCAAALAAYRLTLYPLAPGRTPPIAMAYNLVMGSAFATFLTGTVVMASRREGGDVPPGRWLLPFGIAAGLADGLAAAAYYGVAILAYHFRPEDGAYPPAYLLICRVARSSGFLAPIPSAVGWGLGVPIVLATWWAVRRRLRGTWPAVFLAFAATALFLAGGSIAALVGFYSGAGWGPITSWSRQAARLHAGAVAACAIAIMATVGWDVAHRRRTDGLHWAGVLAWLGIATAQLVAYAAFRR